MSAAEVTAAEVTTAAPRRRVVSTRLLRSVGQTVNAASLLSTYRRLCDCLAEGRMFHAGG